MKRRYKKKKYYHLKDSDCRGRLPYCRMNKQYKNRKRLESMKEKIKDHTEVF